MLDKIRICFTKTSFVNIYGDICSVKYNFTSPDMLSGNNTAGGVLGEWVSELFMDDILPDEGQTLSSVNFKVSVQSSKCK